MLGRNTQIEILILAAGASRRLGEPKQLVKYEGDSLIRRIATESIKADIGNVTVVTGYEADIIAGEISDLSVDIFYNEEWEEGIGASIRNGLEYIIKKQPDTNAILITMVDQPFVTAQHLQKIANAYDPARPMIIASAYSGTFGVPVLVDNYYFEKLRELKGDEGGKKIFVQYLKDIVEIPFIAGAIDIDHQEDLAKLK
jgi:molybdenum cofactor cytidylyltransferase